MGRKKKVKIEENTSNVTPISYHGNVRIQYLKGNKVVKTINYHNAGLSELFRYIANCIAGNHNSSYMPRYIHLFSYDGTDTNNKPWDTQYSTCSTNIAFSTVQVRPYAKEKNNTLVNIIDYVTEFTFMISYNQLRKGSKSNYICLYNAPEWGSENEPMAFIKIEDKDAISQDSNNPQNILITWQLIVSNNIVNG